MGAEDCANEALWKCFRNQNYILTEKFYFFLIFLGYCLSLFLFRSHYSVFFFLLSSFQAMFSLCMVESGADEVNLRGVTSLGLKQALEFAYTGQVRCRR